MSRMVSRRVREREVSGESALADSGGGGLGATRGDPRMDVIETRPDAIEPLNIFPGRTRKDERYRRVLGRSSLACGLPSQSFHPSRTCVANGRLRRELRAIFLCMLPQRRTIEELNPDGCGSCQCNYRRAPRVVHDRGIAKSHPTRFARLPHTQCKERSVSSHVVHDVLGTRSGRGHPCHRSRIIEPQFNPWWRLRSPQQKA